MRFLAVGAHPDDIESNAAGTLARMKRAGHEVACLICTDGAKGSEKVEDGPRLKQIRQEEQRAASRVIGVDEVFFLDYVDGELRADLPLRRDISRIIRIFKPDVVLSWDPSSYWFGAYGLNHPDHMATGQETAYAVYPSARDNLMFPELYNEGLEGFKTRELWMFGTNQPNLFIDIGQTFDKKMEALSRHVSQVNVADLAERMRARLRRRYRAFSNPITQALQDHPEYVESFRRIALDPIEDLMTKIAPAWFDD